MHWRLSTPAGNRPPAVFVPGWGFDGRILGLARPPLPWHAPESVVDPAPFQGDLLGFLDREGLARVRLIGWSMGAHLALDFARAHPGRVASLDLLAMRREWPAAEIEQIRRELAADPQGFLAAFYRKCFLGDRALYRLFQSTLEAGCLREPPLAVLHRGLDYLAQARSLPAPVPTRLVHGRRDLIVPLAERAELPGAESEVLDHAGHLVFLGAGCTLAGAARKESLRRRFSQAAPTYDRHAGIQHEAAALLASRLPAGPVGSVLEIGCGTGRYTLLLANRYPGARITALDFSPAMIEVAAGKLDGRPDIRFRDEDAELFLERAATSFDLITSNAACHWFGDLPAALANASRLLNPSGLFWASIFGPETLGELRQGLSFLFGREVPLPSDHFPAEDFLRRLMAGHLTRGEVEEVRIVRQYWSLPDLLHHIRNTGTAGFQEGPPPVFTRGRLRRLDAWFAERHGGYRLTYQVFLVRGEK
ncbi:MAG: methyltransferase domain-containing protein [Desulfobacteraceae bacterium]|nr:methyltransferase domain-containing protein [Desulfobacteraceae bacterium]